MSLATANLTTPSATDAMVEPTPDFLAELAEHSARLETASPEEIISWGAERFGSGLTMATAFGPEGCLILSMLAKVAPTTYVFNLDTGYQFQATLDLRDRIAEQYGIEVEMLKPELSVPEYEAEHDGPLYKTNPNQCCFDRKIKVLHRGLAGRTAWMSGIRRDQSSDRAAGGHCWMGQEIQPGEDQPARQFDQARGLDAHCQ